MVYITAMKTKRDKTRQGTQRCLHVKFPHHSRVKEAKNERKLLISLPRHVKAETRIHLLHSWVFV